LGQETEVSPVAEEQQWATVGRKRKKGREQESLLGVKLRKRSSTSETPKLNSLPRVEKPKVTASTAAEEAQGLDGVRGNASKNQATAAAPLQTKPTTTSAAGLGLGGYSSEDED